MECAGVCYTLGCHVPGAIAMKPLLCLSLLLLVTACKHPLEIKGKGHIIERIYGERGCTLEEFEAGSPRCTENTVRGERYLVSYEAVPEPGWEFVRWEGLACLKDSVEPYCEYDTSQEGVDKFNAADPDAELPATVAVFRKRNVPSPTGLDLDVHRKISRLELTGDPRTGPTPAIRSPMAQLGMKLFFSKSLSGEFDTACASCHHPRLAGGDALSLPIGTGAEDPDLMGPGRKHRDGQPRVGRNSPTTFNSALYPTSLFWDGRVALLSNGSLNTPDAGGLGRSDPNAGTDLLAAQARFPVDEPDEMRSHNFMTGADGQAVREHLAARIGDYGPGKGEIENNNWLPEFEAAFGTGIPVEEMITYENIALAISVYQQSQSFVNSPWRAYVHGDYDAISSDAKRGALLFMEEPPDTGIGEDGPGCALCHEGDFFTNEEFDAVGFPQIGPGKGEEGAAQKEDRGRGALTSSAALDYRFRNPSLLNVGETAPYGHAGAYATLEQAVRHYGDPEGEVKRFFSNGGWCKLEQFADLKGCSGLYPDSEDNTGKARAKVLEENDNNRGMPVIDKFTDKQVKQIVAFLKTLTDPCIRTRKCIAPWIPKPEDAPDGHQLNAVDANGKRL